MALVLCTGVNSALMRSRRYILERAGHTVVTATDDTTLFAACAGRSFHVAVIGQSAGPAIKRRIAALVREQCPDVKVLELYDLHTGRSVEDADSWLEAPVDVPKDLADRVDELAKSDGNESGKSEKEEY